MILTEDEAQKKWCPFARVPNDDEGFAVNRKWSGEIDRGALCIGSACMAWRQVETHWRIGDIVARHTGQWPPDDRSGWFCGDWTVDEWRGFDDKPPENSQWYLRGPDKPPRGYCGNAGNALVGG